MLSELSPAKSHQYRTLHTKSPYDNALVRERDNALVREHTNPIYGLRKIMLLRSCRLVQIIFLLEKLGDCIRDILNEKGHAFDTRDVISIMWRHMLDPNYASERKKYPPPTLLEKSLKEFYTYNRSYGGNPSDMTEMTDAEIRAIFNENGSYPMGLSYDGITFHFFTVVVREVDGVSKAFLKNANGSDHLSARFIEHEIDVESFLIYIKAIRERNGQSSGGAAMNDSTQPVMIDIPNITFLIDKITSFKVHDKKAHKELNEDLRFAKIELANANKDKSYASKAYVNIYHRFYFMRNADMVTSRQDETAKGQVTAHTERERGKTNEAKFNSLYQKCTVQYYPDVQVKLQNAAIEFFAHYAKANFPSINFCECFKAYYKIGILGCASLEEILAICNPGGASDPRAADAVPGSGAAAEGGGKTRRKNIRKRKTRKRKRTKKIKSRTR